MTRRRLLALAAGAAAAPALAVAAWIALPVPAALLAPPAVQSLLLEDRHGTPLRATRGGDGARAGWRPIGEIDPQLLQAFVATEDRRFFDHHGVDPRAAARALADLLRPGRPVSGASTITMQTARLVRGTGGGWRAKPGQVLWALRLEAHLTKQQILEQYLNRVPLGQGAVGVEAAASLYCSATSARVSLAQAALLAGLASAPSLANPVVDPGRAARRRDVALARMHRAGYVTGDQAAAAALEPLGVPRAGAFLAPHFTTRVLLWEDSAPARRAGRQQTSLDLGLQAALEGEVRHTVALLHDRGVRHGAAIVLDNATGEILAWVGSPDFAADSVGQVDMVTSPRQAGSTLKPFLYGMAFDRGYSPATVLPDLPRVYQTSTGPYQPRNYDRRYHGPVRVREALASSFNVPAVDLADRIGTGAFLAALHAAGFASLDRGADHYGLGLVIGNGDVTLLELANAYRGLANGGRLRAVSWWAGGEPDTGGTRFMSGRAAALTLDILADADARVPGFGIETPFDFPFPAAVKTGTSHHFTDNWAIGVTGGFTVAVWVGDFTGRPMRQVSGVTGAGPLLQRAMLHVARLREPGVLPAPGAAGAVRVAVCRVSGRGAGARCPRSDEWVTAGHSLEPCDWHRADGSVAWPAAYAGWAAQAGHDVRAASVVPVTRPGAAALRIVSPRDGDRFEVPPGGDARYATIALRTDGAGAARVAWKVDGRAAAGDRWRLRSGVHVIEAFTDDGRADRVTIAVR